MHQLSLTHIAAVFLFCVVAGIGIGCQHDCPGCSDDDIGGDSLAIVDAYCDLSGDTASGRYAMVNAIYTGDDFRIAVADTTRMKELGEAWMPFVCNGLPDSLKLDGLELLVDLVDKTTTTESGALVSTIELVNARLLREHPDEDPRNGGGVHTADILVSPLAGEFWHEYVIRTADEWEQVSRATGAQMGTPVDFSQSTLLGYKVMIGGCWPGGHFSYRTMESAGDRQFTFHIFTKSYGLCQVGYARWHWVTVARLDEADEVIFDFEEVVF